MKETKQKKKNNKRKKNNFTKSSFIYIQEFKVRGIKQR